jgi:hypothetical protein
LLDKEIEMTKITIEVHNEEDKRLILELVNRRGLESVEEETEKAAPEANGQKIASLMQDLAESTTLSKIKDPVAWQREIRQDRKLPFRD